MNKEMLKTLVELSREEVDGIDHNVFFTRYRNDATTLRDLRQLKRLGYIALLEAEAGAEIVAIGVNQAAIDYFK